MTNKFDELTKGLAQSVTRRAALKKFGVAMAAIALASLGLANKAHADGLPAGSACKNNSDCASRVCQHYKIPCGPTKDICGHLAFCQ